MEFLRKAASQESGFFTRDDVMWCRSFGSSAVGCHAVIEDWIVPVAAYTAADTQCFLDNCPKWVMLKTSGDAGDACETRRMLWRRELWQLRLQGSS